MKIQNGVLVSYTGQEEHLIIPREVTVIAPDHGGLPLECEADSPGAFGKPGRSLRESTGLWV